MGAGLQNFGWAPNPLTWGAGREKRKKMGKAATVRRCRFPALPPLSLNSVGLRWGPGICTQKALQLRVSGNGG